MISQTSYDRIMKRMHIVHQDLSIQSKFFLEISSEKIKLPSKINGEIVYFNELFDIYTHKDIFYGIFSLETEMEIKKLKEYKTNVYDEIKLKVDAVVRQKGIVFKRYNKSINFQKDSELFEFKRRRERCLQIKDKILSLSKKINNKYNKEFNNVKKCKNLTFLKYLDGDKNIEKHNFEFLDVVYEKSQSLNEKIVDFLESLKSFENISCGEMPNNTADVDIYQKEFIDLNKIFSEIKLKIKYLLDEIQNSPVVKNIQDNFLLNSNFVFSYDKEVSKIEVKKLEIYSTLELIKEIKVETLIKNLHLVPENLSISNLMENTASNTKELRKLIYKGKRCFKELKLIRKML